MVLTNPIVRKPEANNPDATCTLDNPTTKAMLFGAFY
jgi:hypothetical protein